MRMFVSLCLVLIASAGVYVFAVAGEDPLGAGDPRVCAETGAIASDASIVDAALLRAIENQEDRAITYETVEALKASDPHIRFNADWHWQRWQEDRQTRMTLARSGLQYAYTVAVAYRYANDGDKPFVVESYRVDECTRAIGDGQTLSRGYWSANTFEDAKRRAAAPNPVS
ncbi:MAG: hypothetical protein AAGJ32_07485 [Pseudomonadota bacterium]